MSNTPTTNNDELIQALSPEDADEYGFTHEVIQDFRGDFPATQDGYGNNDVAAKLRKALGSELRQRVDVDSEFSCLYLRGSLDDLRTALGLLSELVADGWGAR